MKAQQHLLAIITKNLSTTTNLNTTMKPSIIIKPNTITIPTRNLIIKSLPKKKTNKMLKQLS
jgi:hypothetical protein